MTKNENNTSPTFTSKLWSLVQSKAATISMRAKRRLGINIEYSYHYFTILLSSNHMLPIFQKFHPLYDRFLPHLCKYLGNSGTVIDVGANCGDTLAAMITANKQLAYICVEPDDYFHAILTKNIKRITAAFPQSNITTFKALIGKFVTSAKLEGFNGTKHAVINNKFSGGNNIQMSRTLDSIILESNVSDVRLLKSDVDGFDYDVLDSARDLITQQSPILFFECQLDFKYQKVSFEETIDWLSRTGYDYWAVFDNFGELILHTDDIIQVKQILDYVWRIGNGHSTITFPYVDILAATNSNRELLTKSLNDYVSFGT